jgi:ATP-binding cassette subfamily B protein
VFLIFLITLLLAAINAAEPLILELIFESLIPNGPDQILLQGLAMLLGLGIFREIATAY